MATTLTFGGVSLLSALQLAPGGIRQSQGPDGRTIEVYDLVARSSIANNINYFDLIDDQIEQAIRYTNNNLNDTPVYLVEYANGETAKQAVVYSATLTSESRGSETRLMKFNHIFGKLAVTRGPWENTSATTGLSTVEFDWDDPTQAVASVPGTMGARINKLKIEATSTNTETTPLTETWLGIREEYNGYTNFSPIWELEAGTIEDSADVALVDVADSNTSPTGSSTGNALECDFDNVATMKKRVSLTLGQVTTGIDANNEVTNGGFETGDLTGWTINAPGLPASTLTMTSDATNPNLGSRALRYSAGGAGGVASYYQDISVSTSIDYQWGFSIDVSSISADGQVGVNLSWRDSGGDLISNVGGVLYNESGTSGYIDFSGVNTSPGNADALRIIVYATNTVSAPLTVDFDDFVLYALTSDDWVGRYLVLLRAYNTAASTENYVQMKFGYSGSTNKSPSREILVDGVDWKLYPLGYASFPPGRTITDDTESLRRLNQLQIELWARTESGAGSLRMDALFFVPSNHVFRAGDIQIARSSLPINPPTNNEYKYSTLYVYTTPEGRIEGIADGSDFLGVDTNIEFSPQGWTLPPGNNIFVAVAQRDASHELADTFKINMTYLPRWRNFNDA